MLALARPYLFILISCLLLFVCRSHRKILSTEKLIPEYSVKDVGGGVADHLLDSHPWQESYLLFHFLQTSLFPQALGRGIFSSSFSHCYCSSQGGGRGTLCVGEWVEGNDCVATGDDDHDDENKSIEDDDDDDNEDWDDNANDGDHIASPQKSNGELMFSGEISGLTPGKHGFHVHQVANIIQDCVHQMQIQGCFHHPQ